jgi:hypothetical protein
MSEPSAAPLVVTGRILLAALLAVAGLAARAAADVVMTRDGKAFACWLAPDAPLALDTDEGPITVHVADVAWLAGDPVRQVRLSGQKALVRGRLVAQPLAYRVKPTDKKVKTVSAGDVVFLLKGDHDPKRLSDLTLIEVGATVVVVGSRGSGMKSVRIIPDSLLRCFEIADEQHEARASKQNGAHLSYSLRPPEGAGQCPPDLRVADTAMMYLTNGTITMSGPLTLPPAPAAGEPPSRVERALFGFGTLQNVSGSGIAYYYLAESDGSGFGAKSQTLAFGKSQISIESTLTNVLQLTLQVGGE